MISIQNQFGSVVYSESTIANIVRMSIMEIPGVVGMVSQNTTDGIKNILNKDNSTKGIKIIPEDDGIVIKISVIACYGTKLPEVAKNIASKAKNIIETTTDVNVREVTVLIEGVKVQD